MEKKLSVVVISLTPFDAAGKLDEPQFRRQLGRLRDAGCAVYVAGSGSSEAYSYTPDELDRVLEISVEELKGKVPFRAMGCEPHLPSEMINFMKHAERAKVDAAQIFSLDVGHGSRPSDAELEAYYCSVIDSTSLPIYLSSHRSIGYHLPLPLISKLVDRYPQIAGINYAGPDIAYIAELIRRVGERIEVHCAGPTNALSVLGLGGNGFMGGEGNFLPSLVQEVIEAWKAKDFARIRIAFDRLMAFHAVFDRFGGSSMRGGKSLNNAFGLPGGTLRAPRKPISKEECDAMVKAVQALNLPNMPELVTK